MKPGAVRRYFTVVGIILGVLLGLGVWLKPPLEQMRENVETGLTEYARTKATAGETLPPISHQETKDWIIAVSHTATVGDETFFCVGGFKVTYCDIP